SKEFSDFLATCLVKDPQQRPNAEDLLKHSFLATALDKKPVIELISEYKAEVFEEVTEESDDLNDLRLKKVACKKLLQGSPVKSGCSGRVSHQGRKYLQVSSRASLFRESQISVDSEASELIPTVVEAEEESRETTILQTIKDGEEKVEVQKPRVEEPQDTKASEDELSTNVANATIESKVFNDKVETGVCRTDQQLELKTVHEPIDVPSQFPKDQKTTGEEYHLPETRDEVLEVRINKQSEKNDDMLEEEDQQVERKVDNKNQLESQEQFVVVSSSGDATENVIVTTATSEVSDSTPDEPTSTSQIKGGEVVIVSSTSICEDKPSGESEDVDEENREYEEPNTAEAVNLLIDEAIREQEENEDSKKSPDVTWKPVSHEVTVSSSHSIVEVNEEVDHRPIDSPESFDKSHVSIVTVGENEQVKDSSLTLEGSTIESTDVDNLDFQVGDADTQEQQKLKSGKNDDNVVVIQQDASESKDLTTENRNEVVVINSSISEQLSDEQSIEFDELKLDEKLEETNKTEDSSGVFDDDTSNDKSSVKTSSSSASSEDKPKIKVNLNLKKGSSSLPSPPVSPGSIETERKLPASAPSTAPSTPAENEGLTRRSISVTTNSTSLSHKKEISDTESVSTLGSTGSRESSDKEKEENQVVLRKRKEQEQHSNVPNIVRKVNNTASNATSAQRKTLKRTRKFVIDGVVVTTTQSKVIYGDEDNKIKDDHFLRKQEMRELKMLQKQETKQFQDLAMKAQFTREQQEKRFEQEMANLLRNYDTDLEALNRQQKQMVERAEQQQETDLKVASKKIRSEQERELKAFRDSMKSESKLLKQEVELLPKDKRKDVFRVRKEKLDQEHSERERAFLERLNDNHEISMKRLGDTHREKIALLERQFLQQKQQLLRAREAAVWELEERHLHEKHQLAKRQLKDIFFLQRHQMLIRHEKELEQIKRMNSHKEDELLKRQAVEKKQLPKRIRTEMKTRELMFRESLRISMVSHSDSPNGERNKIRKFQEGEKKRYKAEQERQELKHKRQFEELRASCESAIKELEQLQNEKRKMLMEHETAKLKQLEEEHTVELKDWKNNLKPRKQKLEEDFIKQQEEQEKFYGSVTFLNEYMDNKECTVSRSYSTSGLEPVFTPVFQ
ncbi:serine/threonine-protein kinase 10-like, partial [Limulus polyphemus]|uniref:Serine/threonine-protein kinase 10-like n=1 Tax=Limulus polyphemus TaxID=6850 RepID=A0ABM1TIB2_LIMPO